jgi:hypothetical protein
MSVCDGLGEQTTVQVINKTTSEKNQKLSSGGENDIGDRGGQSLLATASRREKGGKAGVEGERLSDNFNDARDGCDE